MRTPRRHTERPQSLCRINYMYIFYIMYGKKSTCAAQAHCVLVISTNFTTKPNFEACEVTGCRTAVKITWICFQSRHSRIIRRSGLKASGTKTYSCIEPKPSKAGTCWNARHTRCGSGSRTRPAPNELSRPARRRLP